MWKSVRSNLGKVIKSNKKRKNVCDELSSDGASPGREDQEIDYKSGSYSTLKESLKQKDSRSSTFRLRKSTNRESKSLKLEPPKEDP